MRVESSVCDASELAGGVGEAGRSGDDAVEIGGKSLREHQRLAATGRAAVEVGLGQRSGVVSGDEPFSGFSGDVERAKAEVDKLQVGKLTATKLPVIVLRQGAHGTTLRFATSETKTIRDWQL